MSNIQTSLPVPTQPWEAAKNRFLAGLSQEEVQKFKDATLENVFYGASASQKQHAQGSKAWMLQERLTSLVDGIMEYEKALDVYSNTSALILCPIWGSLRIVLHIASEAGKFQEKMVDMLAQIGDMLPRFRIYQKLFYNHERLLIALSHLYLDVLRFCTRVKDFLLKAKRSIIPMAIVLKGAWKPFRQDFENDIANFRRHQKHVEKEASLAHMIEAAKAHEIGLARRALEIRNTKLKRRHEILVALRTIDYEAKHMRLSGQRHPGTYTWLKDHPLFQPWISSPISTCLTCYGIPGSGKSVLAATIPTFLSGHLHPKSIFCYYYCDYSDANSLDPIYIVDSLIKQIIIQLPLEQFDERLSNPFGDGKPPPILEERKKFLSNGLKYFKNFFLVMDGLDELAQVNQGVIMNLIKDLLQQTSSIARIFVTSRPEEYFIKNALRTHPSFVLSSSVVTSDIQEYIGSMIDAMAEYHHLLKTDSWKTEVTRALITGAQGLFLWVKFQLDEIRQCLTKGALRKCLENLPKDLRETYERIIMKMYQIGGVERVQMLRKIFLWISCARRPLKIEEIEEAVAVDKTDRHLHIERIAHNAGERLVSACGNLITFNEHDHTVSFAHYTIKQYLYTEAQSGLHTCTGNTCIHFEQRTAHHEIGEICVAYLLFSDFETQLVKRPKKVEITRWSAETMIWTGIPLTRRMFHLAHTVTPKISAQTTTAPIVFAVPTEAKPVETLAKRYILLDYITSFWYCHVAGFEKKDPIWQSFNELVLERQLLFEFRPWQEEQHRLKTDTIISARLSSERSSSLWDRVTGYTKNSPLPDRETIYLYTWAFGNCVGSLLRLSRGSALSVYFSLIHTNHDAGTPNWFMMLFTGLVNRSGSNSWNDEVIFSDSWTDSGVGADCVGNACWFEFNAWVQKDENVISLISRVATLTLCYSKPQQYPNPPGYSESLQYPTPPRYPESLRYSVSPLSASMAECLKSPAQMCIAFETLAHIEDGVMKVGDGVWRLLLSHPVPDKFTPDHNCTLASIFSVKLDILQRLILTSDQLKEIRAEYRWILLMLFITEYNTSSTKYLLARPCPHYYKTFVVPENVNINEPRLQRLKELDFTRLDSMTPLSLMFMMAHEAPDVLLKEFLGLLRLLLDRECEARLFNVEEYERRGVHCLNWLIEWDLSSSLNSVKPFYDEFFKRSENTDAAIEIFKKALSCRRANMELIFWVKWPKEAVDIVVKEGGVMSDTIRSFYSSCKYDDEDYYGID